jgi:hypothetical protein
LKSNVKLLCLGIDVMSQFFFMSIILFTVYGWLHDYLE